MTTNASSRLNQLQSNIENQATNIAAMQEKYASLVTAGNDSEADKVAAGIREADARLAILRDRLPVLMDLASQEADEARHAEAEQLTKKANEKQSDLKAKYAKAASAIEQLQKAVSAIEDNAGLNWYLVAKKAVTLGGDPDSTQIEDVRQMLDSLEESKRRLIGINEGYTQRVTQIALHR